MDEREHYGYYRRILYTIQYNNEWYMDFVTIPEGTICVMGSSVALQLISKHALKTWGLRIFDMMRDDDTVLVWNIIENTIPINVKCRHYDNKDGDAVNAIGALGKMSGVLFQSLIDNGLTNDQALCLVKEFISTTLGKASNG